MQENYKQLDRRKTYLITGAAGFIGYYLSRRLLDQGCKVIGYVKYYKKGQSDS